MNKEAQDALNAKVVAAQIRMIINIMLSRISPQSRPKSYQSVRKKLIELNVMDMSKKKTMGGAPIGISIGLVKNILNGRDPYFIQMVLRELAMSL